METQNGTRGIPYNYLDGAMGAPRQQWAMDAPRLQCTPIEASKCDPTHASECQLRLERELAAGPPPRREHTKYGDALGAVQVS